MTQICVQEDSGGHSPLARRLVHRSPSPSFRGGLTRHLILLFLPLPAAVALLAAVLRGDLASLLPLGFSLVCLCVSSLLTVKGIKSETTWERGRQAPSQMIRPSSWKRAGAVLFGLGAGAGLGLASGSILIYGPVWALVSGFLFTLTFRLSAGHARGVQPGRPAGDDMTQVLGAARGSIGRLERGVAGLADAGHFTLEGVSDQLRSLIGSRFVAVVVDAQLPVLDLVANLSALESRMREDIKPIFAEYGLELTGVLIEGISLPDGLEWELDRQAGRDLGGAGTGAP